MKGVKGKFLKKIKSVKAIGYLKQETVFHVHALDGFLETFPKTLTNPLKARTQLASKEKNPNEAKDPRFTNQEPEVIDVQQLMRDLGEEEEGMEVDDGDDDVDDKENVRPPGKGKSAVVEFDDENREGLKRMELNSCSKPMPLGEIDISSFRRPDLDSGTLFDPNLLAAFEMAVQEHARVSEVERQARIGERQGSSLLEKNLDKRRDTGGEDEPPLKVQRIEEEESEEEEEDPLSHFKERCPPGGSNSVVFYTTSLRGIRKTFEDCNSIRFLLESFRVFYFERDVSMHMEFKEELWKVMEGQVHLPTLFIRGRHIGGAEEVLGLHERGKFRVLLRGIPIDNLGPCESCYGFRFVVCFSCSGSHRIVDDAGSSSECLTCNENGLTKCAFCS